MNLLPAIHAALKIAALTAVASTPQRQPARTGSARAQERSNVQPAQPAARAGPDRRWRRSIARSGRGSAESGESKLRGPRGGFHQVSPGPGRTCAPSDAISPSIVVHAVWIQDLILWDEFDMGRASGGASGGGPVSGLRSVAGVARDGGSSGEGLERGWVIGVYAGPCGEAWKGDELV